MVDTISVFNEVFCDYVEELDQDVIEYFRGILTDFSGDSDELNDLICPFLVATTIPPNVQPSLVSRLYQNLYGDGVKKDTFLLLENPINMNEISKELEEGIKKSLENRMNVGKYLNDPYHIPQGGSEDDEEDKEYLNRRTKKDNFQFEDVQSKVPPPDTFFKRRKEGKPTNRDVIVRDFDMFIGGHLLLEDATLQLNYGRKYGLIGRNGIGKTSLLRMISAGELNIENCEILHVEQEVVGDDTLAIVSVLEADVERNELLNEEKRILSLENPTKEDDAKLEAIYSKLAEIESDKAEPLARSILSGLGFSVEDQQKPTREFSGGWRMRIALARALFCQPDLLLLDEPTNMLDIRSVVWLEEYLRDNWEKTLVIVSHDREFLNNISTDIVHLHGKKLVYYTGSYEDYDRVRSENLKNQQRALESQTAYRAHVQKFIDRFRYKAGRASLVQSRIKMLNKLELIPAIIEDPTCSFTFPQPFPIKGPLISLKGVSFGYSDEKLLFNNLSFEIDMDTRVALVGANGQGKSTVLNLLAGLLKPVGGYAVINPRLRFAKFSQHHIDQMNLEQTPLQYLASLYPNKTQNEYRSFLGRYGISGDIVFQVNRTLSGGQKSRVIFAAMSLSQPHIMLLDEPTNHLDIDTVDVLAKALNDFTGGIVLISHDERLLTAVCNELWEVRDGEVIVFPGDFNDYKAKIIQEYELK